MLFWAIVFSSGVHERGYEHGKTEERLASQSLCRIDFDARA
jgi:hypothetical protein